MLRQGPIPPFAHGVLEYAVAVVFLGAPFLFDFESGAATAVALVVGVVTLVVGASSDLPTGLAKVIPVGIHAVLDLVIAAAMIAAPFLFAFSGEGPPTVLFIVGGVFGLLLTIATRFVTTPRPA